MPLPIAHGLIGASLVRLIHPNADLKNWKPLLLGFILANSPDLDFGFSLLFGRRDFHRGLTHSLMFGFLVAAVIFILFRKQKWRVPLAYSAAFFSHTILDYLCGETGGVRLFIPFENSAYRLGLVSFSELSRGFLVTDMLYFSLIELTIFVPLFLLTNFISRSEKSATG